MILELYTLSGLATPPHICLFRRPAASHPISYKVAARSSFSTFTPISFIGNLRDGIDTEANARAGCYDDANPALHNYIFNQVVPFIRALRSSPEWPQLEIAIQAINQEFKAAYAEDGDHFRLAHAIAMCERDKLIDQMLAITFPAQDDL
jgi:hypothetical protein